MITISNTEMATFDRCRRKWLVGYYLGFVPSSEPLTGTRLLGIRVHTAMEGLYGYGLDPLTVLNLLYTAIGTDSPEDAADLRKEHDLAAAMVGGYLEWAEAEAVDLDLKVVATETDLQIPMPGHPDVTLRCRMDQVIQRISDGALLFLDHKTAANFEKHELLAMDPQMRHYCLMQQMAASAQPDAPKVIGGLINTLRRVKRTEKSKPPYYRRDPFYFNPDQIESAWYRTEGIVEEILQARYYLDELAAGGELFSVAIGTLNRMQRRDLRPTVQLENCSWSCDLSGGLCVAMDDGSDWTGMLERSGRWKKEDPYAYYRDDPIRTIRAALAGKIDADQEAGE